MPIMPVKEFGLALGSIDIADSGTLAGAMVAAGAAPDAAVEIASTVAQQQTDGAYFIRMEADIAASRAALEVMATARTKADAYRAGLDAATARYEGALSAARAAQVDGPARAAAATISERMRWGAVFAGLAATDPRIEAAMVMLSTSDMQPDAILAVAGLIQAPSAGLDKLAEMMAGHRYGADGDAEPVRSARSHPAVPTAEERSSFGAQFRGVRSSLHGGSVPPIAIGPNGFPITPPAPATPAAA